MENRLKYYLFVWLGFPVGKVDSPWTSSGDGTLWGSGTTSGGSIWGSGEGSGTTGDRSTPSSLNNLIPGDLLSGGNENNNPG